MMGGGFGGCTINIVKQDSVESLLEKVRAAFAAQTGVTPEAYVMQLEDGVKVISA